MAFWNCKHVWRLENKDVLPSPWEQMSKEERPTVAEPWMFEKKVIVEYHCLKCGKTRKEESCSEIGELPDA